MCVFGGMYDILSKRGQVDCELDCVFLLLICSSLRASALHVVVVVGVFVLFFFHERKQTIMVD